MGAQSAAPGSAMRMAPRPAWSFIKVVVSILGIFQAARLAVAGLPYAAGARGIGYPRCATAVAHHRVETIAFLLEARQQRSLKRSAARQFDTHGIDEAAVDQNFVVDVGAG